MNIIQLWTNWQNAHRRLEADANRLGSAGWTLPMREEPRVITQLALRCAELDAAFMRYYSRKQDANLKLLWADLLASRHATVEIHNSRSDRVV